MTSPMTTDIHELYADNPINLARWCRGDGTDETEAFNAAAQAARDEKRALVIPRQLTVNVEGLVDLRYITTLDLQGIIRVGPQGRIDIGHSARHRVGAHLRVRRVEAVTPAEQTNVLLRVVGMKQAHIWVDYCHHLEFYADNLSTDDASTSYVVVYPGWLRQLTFTALTDTAYPSFAWISQMTFIGGDIKRIDSVSNQFNLNNITFLGTCLESGEVHLDNAYYWRFIESRCEFGTKFWFGPSTSRIVVEDGYFNSPFAMGPTSVLMEDLGTENVLTTGFELQYDRRTLVSLDEETEVWDKSADIAANVVPGLAGLSGPAPNATVLDTGLIPMSGSSGRAGYESHTRWRMPRLTVSSDTTSFRPEFYFYDADKNLVAVPDDVRVEGSATWSDVNRRFEYYANVAASSIVLKSEATITYVRVIVKAGSPLAPFRRLEITGYFTGPSSDYPVEMMRRRMAREVKQTTAPRVGAPPAGTVVRGDGQSWEVTARRETTLSAAADTGAGIINVATGEGIAVGDVLGVVLDTGVTHWATITGISGTGGRDLALSGALPAPAVVGTTAATARWSAAP